MLLRRVGPIPPPVGWLIGERNSPSSRVIPSLVKSGNTTKVNWSATGVSSCTVAGQNGDAWSGLLSAIGGNISKPITGATTYTLSCIDESGTTLTKTATVNIIPAFQEL